MKKSGQATPKELLKKRVANHKQIKIVKDAGMRLCSENVKPQLKVNHNYKKKVILRKHDRELIEDEYRNPFTIHGEFRLTTKATRRRKSIPVPFIMDDPRTINDVDPTFYAVIEGRPLRSFNDIKSYMRDIRDILLHRASIGYLRDQIIHIETYESVEEQEYDKICRSLEKVKDYFVLFAADSFRKARVVQAVAQTVAEKLEIVEDQLEGYSFEYVTLKNQFTNIVGTYKKLSRYRKFLSYLSPSWWDQQYKSLCTIETDLCPSLYWEDELEETETLSLFRRSTYALVQGQPHLYFTRPEELMNVLDCSTRQCLNYMEIDAYFSVILAQKRKYKDNVKKELALYCSNMEDFIEYFTKEINCMNDNADEHKTAFFKLLSNNFYELIASYDSTKLFTCVQYVHTMLFGDIEDPRDKLRTLMLDIEKLYNSLWGKLETMNIDIVRTATQRVFAEDRKNMKLAWDAQRQLREYDVLSKSLYNSFKPSSKLTM